MGNDHVARRQFLQHSATGIAIAVSSGMALRADSTPLARPTGKTDGPVTILLEEAPEALRAKLADALRYCPTGAIAVED